MTRSTEPERAQPRVSDLRPAGGQRSEATVEIGQDSPDELSRPPTGGLPAGVWWRAASFLAIGLLLAFGLLAAVWLFARPLALLVAAIVFAEALAPAIDRLERYLPRPAAVATVYGSIVLLVGSLAGLATPRLIGQLDRVVGSGPVLIDQAQSSLDAWNPTIGSGARQMIESSVGHGAELLVKLPLTLASGLFAAVLVFAMSVYWSVASPDLRRFSFHFIPPSQRAAASEIASEIVTTMGGYVRARALVALIVMPVVFLGLLVVGVEYPVMLALVAGFGELLPFIGPLLGGATAVGMALLLSPLHALAILVFYVVLEQLKGHVVTPLVTHHQTGIPPLLVIFALVAGVSVQGILGALVAPPLAGALRIVILRLVAPAVKRWLETAGSPHPA